MNESSLFFDVELFPDVHAFFDVVRNAPLELNRKPVLFRKLFEGFEVFALLKVLRPNVADEGSDPIDVVGEAHDAEDLDEDETEGFYVVGGRQVAEPDGQHDVDSPIVGPYVLREPVFGRDAFGSVPVVCGVDLRHRREKNCQNVGEAEVEEDHLHERPVLLVVVVLYEAHLELVELLQALRDLCYYEKSKIN